MKDVEIYGKDTSGTYRNLRITTLGELIQAGIARTTNPTVVADGAGVSASFDSLGRQLVTPEGIVLFRSSSL